MTYRKCRCGQHMWPYCLECGEITLETTNYWQSPEREPSMKQHKLSPSADGTSVILIGAYDEEFLKELRAAVPNDDRRWISVAKCWRIDKKHAPVVQRLIDNRYGKEPEA